MIEEGKVTDSMYLFQFDNEWILDVMYPDGWPNQLMKVLSPLMPVLRVESCEGLELCGEHPVMSICVSDDTNVDVEEVVLSVLPSKCSPELIDIC